MRAADNPTVSVIVPTYNRRTRLGRLLAALDRQHRSGVRFEVVITVDGATDGTAEMLARLRPCFPLEVIKRAQGGPAAARNAAIAAATGEVLLFLDDDVVPQDGLFERHLAVHRRDPRAAAVGRMSAPPGAVLPPWLDWEAALLDRHYDRILSGVIGAARRSSPARSSTRSRRHSSVRVACAFCSAARSSTSCTGRGSRKPRDSAPRSGTLFSNGRATAPSRTRATRNHNRRGSGSRRSHRRGSQDWARSQEAWSHRPASASPRSPAGDPRSSLARWPEIPVRPPRCRYLRDG